MDSQLMNDTPLHPSQEGTDIALDPSSSRGGQAIGELLEAQDGESVSSKEPPGLSRATMESYAVEGAKAFLPFVDRVIRWLSKQIDTDIDTLGPRLFDQFAGEPVRGLTDELHSSMLYGSESAWTSLLREIPGLKKILKTAETFTPKKALKHFKSKVPLPAETFKQLNDDLRAQAFTVTNWTSTNFLVDTQNSLTRALEKGESYGTWLKGAKEKFKSAEFREAVPGQIKTVFNNAMLSSYSVQRYHGIMAAESLRPFGQYKTMDDGKVRDDHVPLHDKIYELSNAIWNTLWPPNGHRCRGWVKTLSQRQMDAQGLSVSKPVSRRFIDAGWASNPALGPTGGVLNQLHKEGTIDSLLGFKNYKLDNKVAGAVKGSALPKSVKELKSDGLSSSQIKNFYMNKYENSAGIDEDRPVSVLKDPRKNGGSFNKALYDQFAKTNIAGGRFLGRGVETFKTPTEVWLNPVTLATGKVVERTFYIKSFKAGDGVPGLTIIMQFQRGIAYPIMRTIETKNTGQINKFRSGVLLYEKG